MKALQGICADSLAFALRKTEALEVAADWELPHRLLDACPADAAFQTCACARQGNRTNEQGPAAEITGIIQQEQCELA